MNRLTNLDGAFAQKFQERFPNFNTDEILMATMIHHKWKLSHMATIFQTTLEAIRKRKTRLLNRISDKIEQDIDPEEYLIQLWKHFFIFWAEEKTLITKRPSNIKN